MLHGRSSANTLPIHSELTAQCYNSHHHWQNLNWLCTPSNTSREPMQLKAAPITSTFSIYLRAPTSLDALVHFSVVSIIANDRSWPIDQLSLNVPLSPLSLCQLQAGRSWQGGRPTSLRFNDLHFLNCIIISNVKCCVPHSEISILKALQCYFIHRWFFLSAWFSKQLLHVFYVSETVLLRPKGCSLSLKWEAGLQAASAASAEHLKPLATLQRRCWELPLYKYWSTVGSFSQGWDTALSCYQAGQG